MATATSGEKKITIEGKKYFVRTQVVYQDGLGVRGTLSTTAPIRYVSQYKPEPDASNPLPAWTNLGERDVNSKNNWIFTPVAGAGFRKALISNGPTSLTTSLDEATANALSKSSGTTVQQAKNILQTAPNAAPIVTYPNQGPSQGSPVAEKEPEVNLEPQSLSVSIPEKASDKSDSNLNVNLRYPENMSDSQDNIIFGVKKLIGRKGINELSAGADFSLGENKYSNVLGTVVLPVQPSITDSNGVEWGGSTLNPIQAYAASKSMSMIDAPGGDITAAAGRALNEAAKDFKTGLTDAGYKKAISLYFAQEAVGAQNLLSRTSGTILNPNLELLFNGPTLRPFNFTFRLSPRSESEAVIVKQIIKFFKTAMAVRRAKSEVFLKAPCIFNISYLTGVGLHQSLNQIKECALIGCDVDYTPDGTYMTFNDENKTMTSYQLSLRFSELTPIYNTDYEDGHPIGY